MTGHDVLTYFWASFLKGPVLSSLPLLLRNMYANKKAAVKTWFGETAEFDIGIGVRPGFGHGEVTMDGKIVVVITSSYC